MKSSYHIKLVQKEKVHKGSVYKIIEHNNFLYTTGADGFVVKWTKDLSQCELVCKTNTANYTLFAFENNIYVGSSTGFCTIINIEEKKLVVQKQLTPKGIFSIMRFQGQILIGTETGELIIVDNELNEINRIQISEKSLRGLDVCSKTLAVASSDGCVYLLNQQLNLEHKIEEHQNSVFAVKYLNDDCLLSGGRDAKLLQTDFKSLLVNKVDAHLSTINAIEFSPRKSYIVTASRDKSFKIWNAETLELLKVMSHQKEKRFSPYSVNSVQWVNENIYTVDDSGHVICWEFTII